jgi:hypothetical protein
MFVVLGVLLARGASAFTGVVIAYDTSGGPTYTPEIFGQSLPTLNTMGVFCAGLALAFIFCTGLWLISGGRRRRLHRGHARRFGSRRRRTARWRAQHRSSATIARPTWLAR